jgi:hypothetical protein
LLLEPGEGLVRFVRLREVGHHALEFERRFGHDQLDQRQRLIPTHPISAHAGVDLEMHRHAFPKPGGHPRQMPDRVRLVDAHRQIVATHQGNSASWRSPSNSIRPVTPASRSTHGLLERADPKEGRAFGQGHRATSSAP